MKVVKVRFKDTNEEHFFTSYTAVYDNFSKEDIGVVIGSVWNRIKKEGKYENSKVEIKAFPLKSRNRKSKN